MVSKLIALHSHEKMLLKRNMENVATIAGVFHTTTGESKEWSKKARPWHLELFINTRERGTQDRWDHSILVFVFTPNRKCVRFGLALATAPGVHLMAMSTTFHLIGVMRGNVYEPGVPAPLMSSYH